MNDIIKKAQQIGINPSQNKGQNFLIDEEVLQGIITIADIKKKDQILEIGPGFGVLTRELLYAGADVLSVELDKKLAAYLKKEFKDNSHLQILEKDILSVSNQEIFKALNGAFRVVSNIPYHITGKIIKKLVSSELPKPESAVLLVQKEVAERVCAEKGNMSMLALSVQAYACPRIALDVDKESFWPVPKVDSSVLVIEGIRETLRTPLCPPLVKGGKGGEASLEKGGEASLEKGGEASLEYKGGNFDEKRFWQVARIGFSSPRKQLRNNLGHGLRIDQGVVSATLESIGLKHTVRAQELGVDDWLGLITALD